LINTAKKPEQLRPEAERSHWPLTHGGAWVAALHAQSRGDKEALKAEKRPAMLRPQKTIFHPGAIPRAYIFEQANSSVISE
jgi:hypothetical protein